MTQRLLGPHSNKGGVPVKRTINTSDGFDHDNFYLIRLSFFGSEIKGRCRYTSTYHLFTFKELMNAIARYDSDAEFIPAKWREIILGYVNSLTYRNRNKVLTTRFFCRFQGDQIIGLNNRDYCALFTSRELKRSRERVERYLSNRSRLCRFFKRLMFRVRNWALEDLD